jgi:CBS domain-containing membrane protein
MVAPKETTMRQAQETNHLDPPLALSDADILAAMREAGGYLDIAPADVLTLYRRAYAHALARLARDVPVAAIMTERVAVIAPGADALAAARRMAESSVSGLPVLDGGTVVGVLSLRDLLRHLRLPAEAGPAALAVRLLDPRTCAAPETPQALGQTPVAALMTSPAVVVAKAATRLEAARLMAEKGINRLPVLDGTRLCGIVSRGDVVRSCRGIAGGCGV